MPKPAHCVKDLQAQHDYLRNTFSHFLLKHEGTVLPSYLVAYAAASNKNTAFFVNAGRC